jgi:hypothetical protein
MQPLGRTVRRPFDGKPKTREETDENGNPAFRVIVRALTPRAAKIADNLGETTTAGLILLIGGYILEHDLPPTALLFAAAIWFLHPLFEKLWREALKRNVEMLLTADRFCFRRGMRWTTINRVLRDRFALVVHDLARPERDRHELEVAKAQKRGKIVQPKRYFGESYHLCYELIGQRNDITEIYGGPEARAVLTRLRAIDEVLNSCARRGNGTAIRPGDQWVEQPGAIPDTTDR